jgi:Spy/CpxP family protein refolding chaperone
MKGVLFRTGLTLACAGALAATALAQTGSGTSSRQFNRFSRLQKALNLSDSQVSQIRTLRKSQAASIQPLWADVKAKRQALRAALQGTDTSAIGSAAVALRTSQSALKNARQANRQAIMATLTPSQAQIMKDYETIARAGGAGLLGRGRGFGPRGGPGARLESRS